MGPVENPIKMDDLVPLLKGFEYAAGHSLTVRFRPSQCLHVLSVLLVFLIACLRRHRLAVRVLTNGPRGGKPKGRSGSKACYGHTYGHTYGK